MLTRKFLRQEKGFSLVELMIVVGIIGILATLALPRFKEFQAKARMSEAKVILNGIYALQESHHLDTNQYVSFGLHGRNAQGVVVCPNDANAQQIGFVIDPCVAGAASPTPRYGYSVVAQDRRTYVATAATGANANNLVCPGKAAHQFTMNESRAFAGPTSCQ